jgi:glycosyltransferase involved in cell wall biosynthesis
VKSLGIESNVLFMGNQKEVAGFYNAADMFVFFPEFEGFGIVALEAMASELPIIVSQGSAFPEILGKGGGIMVDPDSPVSAAATIRSLLQDRERMALLGKEGRESVLKKYSWEAVAVQFERLFVQQLRS